MTWPLLASIAIILMVLGLLRLLHADFMFKLYAVAAGTLLAGFYLGLVTCRSPGVLCDEMYLTVRVTARALDALQTPLAIAIVLLFGAIEREARKRKAKQPAPPATTPPPNSTPAAAPPMARHQPVELATVNIKSTPDGAEITIDGKFVGSTPSTVPLAPGDHEIVIQKTSSSAQRIPGGEVSLPSYRTWRRTLTLSPGGTITVDATLEQMR